MIGRRPKWAGAPFFFFLGRVELGGPAQSRRSRPSVKCEQAGEREGRGTRSEEELGRAAGSHRNPKISAGGQFPIRFHGNFRSIDGAVVRLLIDVARKRRRISPVEMSSLCFVQVPVVDFRHQGASKAPAGSNRPTW